MKINPGDYEVRSEALATIERGLITFTRELVEGAENEFLSHRVNEIMSQLKRVSTSFLTEAASVPSSKIFNTIYAGIDDETRTLEYLLFSPSDVAIMDIKKALGVKTLLDTPLDQRKGLRVALNVSHAIRFVYSQRSGTDTGQPPHAGFVTAEVLSVILQHPDREEAITSYVRERGLVSDEISPEHLDEYLSETPPLAAGML
jgi:hypothetical protein